jgi:hypothetical protein
MYNIDPGFATLFFKVGSLSLLSSAAASDDQSDLNDSETGESTPPLFLQVSVNFFFFFYGPPPSC